VLALNFKQSSNSLKTLLGNRTRELISRRWREAWLPDEVLSIVASSKRRAGSKFYVLRPFQLCSAARVCRQWCRVFTDKKQWQRFWRFWLLEHYRAAEALLLEPNLCMDPKALYLRLTAAYLDLGYRVGLAWDDCVLAKMSDVRLLVEITSHGKKPFNLLTRCFAASDEGEYSCAWPCMPEFRPTVDPTTVHDPVDQWAIFKQQLEDCTVSVLAVRVDMSVPIVMQVVPAGTALTLRNFGEEGGFDDSDDWDDKSETTAHKICGEQSIEARPPTERRTFACGGPDES
jgi:hypothetical protein